MGKIIHLVKVRKLEAGTLIADINNHCPFFKENEKTKKCYDGKTDEYCKSIVEGAVIKDLPNNKFLLQCNYE